MANVKTVTLAAVAVTSVSFDASYPYYWIDNQSDSTVYAAIGADPVPDTDGTFTVAAGGKIRLSGGIKPEDIKLKGSGKVQVYASGIAECPFKKSSKGGDGGGVKTVNGVSPDEDGNVDVIDIILKNVHTEIEIEEIFSGDVTNTNTYSLSKSIDEFDYIVIGTKYTYGAELNGLNVTSIANVKILNSVFSIDKPPVITVRNSTGGNSTTHVFLVSKTEFKYQGIHFLKIYGIKNKLNTQGE